MGFSKFFDRTFLPGLRGQADQSQPAGIAPTEATPLNINATLAENAASISEYSKKQGAKMGRRFKEENLSFRVLALLGGVIMIVSSSIDFVLCALTLHFAKMIVSAYTVIFGIMICLLDSSTLWRQWIHYYVRMLEFTWGRGLFYLFAGTLQFPQGNRLSSLSGGFMIFVGIIALGASYSATKKLSQLHDSIGGEHMLAIKFHECDTDGTGSLNAQQFLLLFSNLGIAVTNQELAAFFSCINKGDDQQITLDEFRFWWAHWGSNAQLDPVDMI
mmetsp:Transcript_36159/g.53018  ORF Transcript_36159/g.53018 Transcript_36159/m.53018 type:complete len:273 (-) Transcript_36159:263-1081(-)